MVFFAMVVMQFLQKVGTSEIVLARMKLVSDPKDHSGWWSHETLCVARHVLRNGDPWQL